MSDGTKPLQLLNWLWPLNNAVSILWCFLTLRPQHKGARLVVPVREFKQFSNQKYSSCARFFFLCRFLCYLFALPAHCPERLCYHWLLISKLSVDSAPFHQWGRELVLQVYTAISEHHLDYTGLMQRMPSEVWMPNFVETLPVNVRFIGCWHFSPNKQQHDSKSWAVDLTEWLRLFNVFSVLYIVKCCRFVMRVTQNNVFFFQMFLCI